MLSTALALAKKNWCVFPCMPRDKVPATPHGCKDATAGADTIRQWWAQNPEFNLAIATGAPSGVFVIDVDGLDAEAELHKLEAEHGPLPSTVETVTPRGRHLFFLMPEMPVRNSASQVAPGLDVRGDGGYVLVPPSVHPSGRRYCWSVDSASVIAAAPAWLIKKITTPTNGAGATTPPSVWRELARVGVGEGARDCTVTLLAGYLMCRLVDPVVTLELLQAWNSVRCTPPLPQADIERIVGSIAGAELRRRGHG